MCVIVLLLVNVRSETQINPNFVLFLVQSAVNIAQETIERLRNLRVNRRLGLFCVLRLVITKLMYLKNFLELYDKFARTLT